MPVVGTVTLPAQARLFDAQSDLIGSGIEVSAQLFSVRMPDFLKDGQGLLPGVAGGVSAADEVVGVAEADKRVGLAVAAVCLAVEVKGVAIAGERLVVLA